MHHVAWSSPGSAPHSGHGSVSAGSKMAVRSRSLLRLRARASSNRRCRPFFTGQLPRRLRSAGKCIAGRTGRCPRWCAARGVPMYFLSRPRRKANSDVPYSRSRDRTVVEDRRRLPDLPPVLRRRRRRRRRRPRGHPAPPRPPGVARRRRPLALAVLPLAHGRLRLRRQRLLRRRPALRRPRRLRPPARRRATPAASGAHRLGAQPHLRPAPVVRRPRGRAATDPKRDWYIWRDPAPRRRPAQQLAAGVHATTPAWTSTRPPASATSTCSCPSSPTSTGPTPRWSTAMHDVAALLARPGRRRLPHRRDPRHRQGPGAARRPAEVRRASPTPRSTTRPETHELLRGIRAAARRLPRRPHDGRRGLPARHRAGSPRTTATATSCTWRSTSRRCTRRGTARRWRAGGSTTSPRRIEPRGGWPTWVLSNHDNPRHRTRYGGPRPGPGPPRCCCSRCGARRSSTPARSSAWRTPRSRPTGSSTPAAATAAGRRSRGTRRRRPRLGRDRPVAAVAARRRRPATSRRPAGRPRLDPAPLPARCWRPARRRPPSSSATSARLDAPDGVLAWASGPEGDGDRGWWP